MTRKVWHACDPDDLHDLARDWFMSARRIELQKLANALGISRATAYRWAGNSERLVGEVLGRLVDDTFRQIVKRNTSRGSDRVLEVLERVMRYTHAFKPLRSFLAKNPQLGLRLVASKHGPVQRRTIANLQKLLEAEVAGGTMTLPVDPAVMAYVLTRIMESFLYADLITGETLDLDNASRILKLVLRQDP